MNPLARAKRKSDKEKRNASGSMHSSRRNMNEAVAPPWVNASSESRAEIWRPSKQSKKSKGNKNDIHKQNDHTNNTRSYTVGGQRKRQDQQERHITKKRNMGLQQNRGTPKKSCFLLVSLKWYPQKVQTHILFSFPLICSPQSPPTRENNTPKGMCPYQQGLFNS